MQKRTKLAAAAAAGVAVIATAVAGSASATTGPAPHVLVNVVITDKTVKLSTNHTADITYVDFYLHNRGKLSHTLVMGAAKSVVVKPGQRVHFYVGFPEFGWYSYHVGLHGKKSQKGRFHINSPQPPD